MNCLSDLKQAEDIIYKLKDGPYDSWMTMQNEARKPQKTENTIEKIRNRAETVWKSGSLLNVMPETEGKEGEKGRFKNAAFCRSYERYLDRDKRSSMNLKHTFLKGKN